mgnify:CR=1 FL=1
MPKINFTSLVWPFVILIIALAAFYLKPWLVKPTETISVSSQGTFEATPDIAKITATIESKNPKLDEARSENEKKVSQIITKLKQLKVEEKDIKTQNISAGQGYETLPVGRQEPMMYPAPPRPSTNQFSTSLEITIRSFETTDEIIAALTSNGATNLYGPQLTLSDTKLEEAKSQAREKAVEMAKKKAQELAKASGRNIGKVVKITEQGDYGYPVPMMAKAESDLVQKASQIQPGQNEVSINLSVDFSLK